MAGISLKKPLDKNAHTLFQEIKKSYCHEITELNALMLSCVESTVPLIRDIGQHILAAGGKRIRPIVLLMSARLFNYHGSYHIPLSASLEFIHTATLLHDDVIDESDTRRGQPTANILWDNKSAILMGDFLFSQSFKLMTSCQNMDILKILSSVTAVITQGELLQLTTLGDIHLSEETYYEIISAKTGALFCAATEVGALLGDASLPHQDLMHSIGLSLGKIFQLLDDLLDYGLSHTNIGKSIGDDFYEGKVTLPVILSYKISTPKERLFWEHVFQKQTRDTQDFSQAQEILKAHAIDEKIFETATHLKKEAETKLLQLPKTPERDQFYNLLEFSVIRES